MRCEGGREGGREDSPSSLTVESTGGLSSTQSELRASEASLVTSTLHLSLAVHHTGASSPPDGVAGLLAERLAQVTAGGNEVLEVAQTDGLLAADAASLVVTDPAGLAQGHAAGSAGKVPEGAAEPGSDEVGHEQQQQGGRHGREHSEVGKLKTLSIISLAYSEKRPESFS